MDKALVGNKDFGLGRHIIDDGQHNSVYTIHPIPNYIKNYAYPFLKIFPYKEGVHEWLLGDSEENFKKNLLKAPIDWKYRTKKVTYNLNSHGYRTYGWDQIDWKNAIVLFGCSCTYGEGLSDDETISYHLEKLTGRQVINLGISGGSNSAMIQNAIGLLEFCVTPYAVANIWSTTDRYRFFNAEDVQEVGPWNTGWKDDYATLWKNTFLKPSHEIALAYYEGQVGKWLWKDRTKYASISFFDTTAHYTRADKFFKIDNGARDMLHPGEDNAIEVATYLAERFK